MTMKTKAEIEAALLPNGLPPENSPTWPRERAGSLNAYVCDTCRGALVVVLLDWGTTPFLLSCENYGRHVVLPPGRRRVAPCRGMLSSSFYRVSPLFSAHLSHGFYRPADTGPAMVEHFAQLERSVRAHVFESDTLAAQALEAAKRETVEHVERGGLILRELTKQERGEWARRTLWGDAPPPSRGGSSHPGRFA